jgi:hypothetical protein
MEAILKFQLPEDQQEFDMAVKASDIHAALWDFKQKLRGHIKYEEHPAEVHEMLYKVREELNQSLTDYSVDLDT